MLTRNEDLHGNVPDTAPVALLMIDVISDFEFEDGPALFEQALPMAYHLAELKKRAKQAGVPVIYVNDNYGKWQSDFNKLVQHCLEDGRRGKPIVELLKPDDEDYFVLKPKHSGFYSTVLNLLLEHLQAHTLVLTGVTGNICVLFTANDAYMRDYKLIIPVDCVASVNPEDNRYALEQMQKVLKADITPSTDLDWPKLATQNKS